tara:strand:+ start:294 stop:539 length:246 start_codon:yes stop_codon:yes gene_type:complete
VQINNIIIYYMSGDETADLVDENTNLLKQFNIINKRIVSLDAEEERTIKEYQAGQFYYIGGNLLLLVVIIAGIKIIKKTFD